ncbi:MAG: TIGR01777 family oxidoreductase [Acidobacteriota bacterium]
MTGTIVIAGGSGFLGLSLARHLTACCRPVVVLSRSPPPAGAWTHVAWDGRSLGDWIEALDGAAGLVNLAGRSVDCVKTPAHRDEILRSRVESTRVLGAALARIERRPGVWVQMSTAHLYGDSEHVLCDEDAAFGEGLAPFVGRAWEGALAESAPDDMRTVILRTSFVLGRAGGALQRLASLARWGLGGRVGSGRQGVSWIHERDMNRLLERALDDRSMTGAYLATAPHPVSNAELMRGLRRALRRPIGLPAAAWMVKIAAPLVLRTDPDLALYGRYCVSRRLAEEGFAFDFPSLDAALADLFGG